MLINRKDQYEDRYGKICHSAAQHNERNDCAVRALAVVLDIEYDTAHAMLKRQGRKNRGRTSNTLTNQALAEAGYELIDVTAKYPYAKTIRTLAYCITPDDILLVCCRGHILGVRDGFVHDWTANRLHRVKTIWKLRRIGGGDVP